MNRDVVPGRIGMLVLVLAFAPGAVAAQDPPPTPVPAPSPTSGPSDGTVQVVLGFGLLGGAPLGTADAALRGNPAAPAQAPLFRTTSRIGVSPSAEARIGLALRSWLHLEGHGSYGRPVVLTVVTADREAVSPVRAEVGIRELTVDGGVRVDLKAHHGAARTMPFVTTAVGYLRQFDRTLQPVGSGTIYRFGVGITRRIAGRRSGWLRAETGVRVQRGGLRAGSSDRPRGVLSVGWQFAF